MPSKKPAFLKTLMSCSLVILLSSPLLVSAAPEPEATSGWSWSGHVANLNIDAKAADDQYIDSSAVVFGFAAERYASDSIYTFTAGVDFVSYDDKGSFSQNTTGGVKDSDASAILVYVEYGPRFALGADKANYVTAHAGFSGIFASSRGIGYCSNCYSEDINLDGGAYGSLGIGHSFTSFDIGLQFQQYFTGDLDNSLRLRFSSKF